MRARDGRIDSIKGFLIILVIMGHVITAVDNINIVNHGMMGLIYIFHMPLFILISGYFTKHPDQQKPVDMWRGVANLLITILIFHSLKCVRIHFTGGDFLHAFREFPFGILWYLMCLVYWRIILYYTPRALLRKPGLYLCIALVVSLLCGMSRLYNFLALQRMLNFYVFFVLGFYFRQGQVNTRWWNCNKLHAAVAVLLLPILFLYFPRCGNIMNGADYYSLSGVPGKALVLACSVAMSLLVFNLMPDVKWLRPIGRDSLFYYLFHIPFINSVLGPLTRQYDLPTSFPFIVIYTVIAFAIVWLLNKVAFLKWLTHPFIKPRARSSAP